MLIETEQLLTMKEVAEMFGISFQGVWYWRRTDPYFPILILAGKGERAAIRFHYPDLLRWAEARNKRIVRDPFPQLNSVTNK